MKSIFDPLWRCVALLAALLLAANTARALSGHAPGSGNPILPGYFADPSLVQHAGTSYLYATLDPWGGETLGCWESSDFKHWTYRELNWPSKRACTSPTSKGANVWAPSVVRAPNGTFFMYVSVGNEVWVGASDHPLGPWHDVNGGRPLIPENFRPGFHMIDAEAFVDDDGAAYLYWGSGWNWVNGRCWAVKLKPDMVTFDGEVRDVTPANYFEAPFMLKHKRRYYLMYSNGKTVEDSYQVHYAMGDSPFGPFTEATNSPILVTDLTRDVRGPGHHAVFRHAGRHFILYHRHSIPFDPDFIGRQICVDELTFMGDDLIAKVHPTQEGPPIMQRSRRGDGFRTEARATASSQRTPHTKADGVLDGNHATLWAADTNRGPAWLELDLGASRHFTQQELRFEYPWKHYRFRLEGSTDRQQWIPLADYSEDRIMGSPVILRVQARARFLRLTFPSYPDAAAPALFEWSVR